MFVIVDSFRIHHFYHVTAHECYGTMYDPSVSDKVTTTSTANCCLSRVNRPIYPIGDAISSWTFRNENIKRFVYSTEGQTVFWRRGPS